MKYNYAIITLLFYFLSATQPTCEAQNNHVSCIDRAHITSHSCYLQASTNNLLLVMKTPKRISYNYKETFFIGDSANNGHLYSQQVNLFWFKNIGYRDINGLASLYWISFRNNRNSITIEDQVINSSYTLKDFQKNFDYDEGHTYFQNRKRYLVCEESKRKYYTCICLPICNSEYGEYLVFTFNKNGRIDSIQFVTTALFSEKVIAP